jgi:hypothetical protein
MQATVLTGCIFLTGLAAKQHGIMDHFYHHPRMIEDGC